MFAETATSLTPGEDQITECNFCNTMQWTGVPKKSAKLTLNQSQQSNSESKHQCIATYSRYTICDNQTSSTCKTIQYNVITNVSRDT